MLVTRIYAFTIFWHTSVGPKLGPADWLALMLPAPAEDTLVVVTRAALPHLARMPAEEVVTGNAVEQMRAGLLAEYAAQQVPDAPERHPDSLAAIAMNVLEPPVAPSHPVGAEPLLAPATAGLDRVRKVLSAGGLRYVDLGEAIVGAGIAVCWTETDWAVVSVAAGGLENVVNITAGVLKDVEQDRARILEECNSRTRENTAYPVYLHDAQQGWDVLVQQRFPADVLLADPAFLCGTVANLPVYARQTREEFRAHGLSGEHHAWDAETTQRLLMPSML